jgi:2-polyprenyl-3-methyl-5-hydroxy-6-metoxy-1,4-benzoquinol methylase
MTAMEKLTDWNSLWRELVEAKSLSRKMGSGSLPDADVWESRAEEFEKGVRRRWAKPDSSRDFVLSHLGRDSTVLDIGAGTGAWSALLARHVKQVTAVEPSAAMIEVMRKSLAAEGIANVTIIKGEWPDVPAEPHDFSLCSHAMYGCPDLAAFFRRMNACTKRMCFLVLRAPTQDGVMAEAARHIWKQPLDSPNFTIAYNILIQMGVYANVLMENTGLWPPRTSSSLEEALGRLKRHFGPVDSKYDEYLKELLRRRLTLRNGQYIWPREVRSALVYWPVEA